MIYLMIYLIVGSAFYYFIVRNRSILEVSNSCLIYWVILWPLASLLALLSLFFYLVSELCDALYHIMKYLISNFEPKKLPTWLDNFLTKYRYCIKKTRV